MTFAGGVKPLNDVVQGIAKTGLIELLDVGETATAAEMVPGRLCALEANENRIKEGSAMVGPLGWLGYASSPADFKPESRNTHYERGNNVAVHNGGGFRVLAELTKGCKVARGDLLANWFGGQVVGPVIPMLGGLGLGIPFVLGAVTTEIDTGIDLPAGMVVNDILIDVTALEASVTLDIGLMYTVEGGDPNGFVEAIGVEAVEKKYPDVAITAGAPDAYTATTRGALLADFEAGSENTNVGLYHPKPYVCDGSHESVVYTRSAEFGTAGGIIWLVLASEAFQVVGRALESQDTPAAEGMLWALSSI